MINKKFKDSLFTKLFCEPDQLRELYCALGGVTLPPDVPVSINTLENVLYMDLYNDISFEIGGKLVVLIEHQSTINPNIALRLLLYYSKVTEKRVKGNALYSRKHLSIPWPEFYVLYNGPESFPDEETLRLSDLYENPKDLGLPEVLSPSLDLKVKVININEGRNEAIVNKCKKLSEYTTFTAKIRSFLNEGDSLEEAIEKAVKYCSKHGIMDEFLEIYGSEVLSMILMEWNTEDAIAYAREEGREEGWENANQEVARNALVKGLSVDVISDITGLSLEEIEKLK